MMWNEFLELTGFGETYMTYSDYEKIEKVYMKNDLNKVDFCKKLYSEHCKKVTDIVSMLIRAKTLEQKESFIATGTGFDDIEATHTILKNAFVKTFKI